MAFPSSGALQSSLIDRVPLICRPTNAQSCVFSSYDVIPGAQGGGGFSPQSPPLDPRLGVFLGMQVGLPGVSSAAHHEQWYLAVPR